VCADGALSARVVILLLCLATNWTATSSRNAASRKVVNDLAAHQEVRVQNPELNALDFFHGSAAVAEAVHVCDRPSCVSRPSRLYAGTCVRSATLARCLRVAADSYVPRANCAGPATLAHAHAHRQQEAAVGRHTSRLWYHNRTLALVKRLHGRLAQQSLSSWCCKPSHKPSTLLA